MPETDWIPVETAMPLKWETVDIKLHTTDIPGEQIHTESRGLHTGLYDGEISWFVGKYSVCSSHFNFIVTHWKLPEGNSHG
jgi:hypothetical protein